MKLYAVRCGSITGDAGLFDAGTSSRSYRTVPVMAFLVETSEGVVVFDTGMCVDGRDDPEGYFGPMARRALQPIVTEEDDVRVRLVQAGYEQDDVVLVINSHLHWDHAGMNAGFPAATSMVRACELAGAKGDAADGSPVFRPAEFEVGRLEVFDYETTFDLAGSDRLTLVSTPGHTAGHQCLEVTFASGRRFVLGGDVAYSDEALDAERPPGGNWDDEQARRSVSAMAARSRAGDEVLLPHDVDRWRPVSDVELVHAE